MARRAAVERRPRALPRAIVAALHELIAPEGILARNDVPLRSKEGLDAAIELLAGDVPREIEVSSTACAISPRPGTARRPARFSTSERTACCAGTREWPRARLLQLSRLVRAPPRAARDTRRGARQLGRALDARARNAARNGFTNVDSWRPTRSTICAARRRAGARSTRSCSIRRIREDARLDRARPRLQGDQPAAMRLLRRAACSSQRAAASTSPSRSSSRCRDGRRGRGRRLALREVRGHR